MFGSYGDTGLTPAMRRIEDQLEHGELVPETEKYALKSLDRFQEKLAKMIARYPVMMHRRPGRREFMMVFDTPSSSTADHYVDGIAETRSRLSTADMNSSSSKNQLEQQ